MSVIAVNKIIFPTPEIDACIKMTQLLHKIAGWIAKYKNSWLILRMRCDVSYAIRHGWILRKILGCMYLVGYNILYQVADRRSFDLCGSNDLSLLNWPRIASFPFFSNVYIRRHLTMLKRLWLAKKYVSMIRWTNGNLFNNIPSSRSVHLGQ